MQAIFISEEYSRKGIATAAMGLLANKALDNGCSRKEWYVVKDKAMSKDFYDSIGAQLLEHMAIRRLSHDTLNASAIT